MKIAKDLIELIGNTPLMRVSREGSNADIIAKLEMFNPLSSVKDRVAFSMIDHAEKNGLIKPGDTLIEPTSGNTGIGLAFVAAIKGYQIILTMPETMSIERRKLLHALGAKTVLTEAYDGMEGAVKKAQELAASIPGAYIPQQFENPSNPLIHKTTTAEEIWRDTDGQVDIFVSGVGTGGILSGVGEYLKQKNPEVYIAAVEPFKSSVISGGKAAPHKIQGIGAGFVPKILNRELIDEIIRVKDEDAGNAAREIAKTQGLMIGISSGAALWAAQQLAERPENKQKRILVILPDCGERYLSTWLYDQFDIDENSPQILKSIREGDPEEPQVPALALRYFRNGLSCSESVLKAFNEVYDLGLPEHCLRIASGFGAGIGESGCLCGSVSSAVMVLGLLAGRDKPYGSNRLVFLASNELHRRFREKHKTTCCRSLTRQVEWDSAEHKLLCEGFVFDAAEIADELIQSRLKNFLKK